MNELKVLEELKKEILAGEYSIFTLAQIEILIRNFKNRELIKQ